MIKSLNMDGLIRVSYLSKQKFTYTNKLIRLTQCIYFLNSIRNSPIKVLPFSHFSLEPHKLDELLYFLNFIFSKVLEIMTRNKVFFAFIYDVLKVSYTYTIEFCRINPHCFAKFVDDLV